MSRRRWLLAGAAVTLAAVTVALVIGLGLGRGRPGEVPTLVVSPGRFLQRVTAEGNLSAATSTPLSAPVTGNRRQKIAWIIADGSRVAKGEVVVRFDPTDAEQERDGGIAERDKLDQRLSKARREREATVKNLGRDAAQADAEATNARRFQSLDTSVFSRNQILESSIDTELASERAAFAEGSKQVKAELAGTDIELLEIQRRKAELSIDEAARGLAELAVVAPHDGIVVLERDWRGTPPRVGETAWPGRTLATLPDLAAMQAEVFVLEADAGGLAAGQAATVVVEARPEVALRARVTSVDPVAQRRVGWVPVQFFRAVLTLDDPAAADLKPGQRVKAEITVAELAQAIAIPRQAVVRVDGEARVYRLEGGDFQPVAVELGATTLARVVVTSGLAAGDVIALRDPARAPGAGDAAAADGATVPATGGGE